LKRPRAELTITSLHNDEGPVEALRTTSDRPPLKLVLVAALLPLVLLGAAFLRMLTAERTAAFEEMLERSAVAAGMAIRLYVGEEIGRLEGLAASSALDAVNWAVFQREAHRLLDQHPHWLNIIVAEHHRHRRPSAGLQRAPRHRAAASATARPKQRARGVGKRSSDRWEHGSWRQREARRGVPRSCHPQRDCALHPGCPGMSRLMLQI
jgi:hypothetical protein